MPIKLIIACKKLNVGMATLVEFCESRGIAVPCDPNARIDDHTYLIAAKQFNREVYLQLIASGKYKEDDEYQKYIEHTLPKETALRPYRLERVCREFRMKMRDLVTELEYRGIHVPLETNYGLSREEYDLAREIYLNSPKGQSLLKTELEDIDKDTLKEIWNAHTEVQEQILKLRSSPIRIAPDSIEIIGDKLHVQAIYESHVGEIVNSIADALQINITEEDLERGYIFVNPEVLEQVQNFTKQHILELTASNQVGFSFRPMVDGYIKSRTTNMAKFYELLEQLNIKPELDKKERMLMTIDELQKLKEALNTNKNVDVPTQASAIINIAPSPIFALYREFPFIKFEQGFHKETRRGKNELGERERNTRFVHEVIVNGGYFTKDVAEKLYDKYGLKLNRVCFIFHLTHEAIMSYDWVKNPLDIKKNETGTITYTRQISYTKDPLREEDIEEIENEKEDVTIEEQDFSQSYYLVQRHMFVFGTDLSCWRTSMNRFFGEDGYTLEVKYIYQLQKGKDWLTDEIRKEYEETLRAYLAPSPLSVSANMKSVGIDFDWAEDNLIDITKRLNQEFPQVLFNIYNNHKCKVDIKVSDMYLKETMELMKERYEGIEFKEEKNKQEIYFYRECDNVEQEMQMRDFLVQGARGLSNDKVDVTINQVPDHLVKLRLEDDEDKRKEENAETVVDLRGADFTFGDKPIGRLINVHNYPHLVFDISGNNEEATKELLSNYNEEFFYPNLIGDQEKVARLKESLHKITSGKNVQNPNLSYFIFDAATLRPDANFDEMLKLEMQEINKHLLNTSVNESQKKAIAKALIAEDLALIQGPPGTGKSTAIAEIIWQHIRKDSETRILLTSETNLAVDNAIAKVLNTHHNLVKPIRIGANERLESEGRQFSLEVMQKWAGIKVLNHISGTEDDEFEIGDDSFESMVENFLVEESEDNFEAEDINEIVTTQDNEMCSASEHERNALEKWLNNIANRADKERIPESALKKWKQELDNPEQVIRKAVYDAYIKHCNVIGATCSSIGKENIMLSRLLKEKYGTESYAFCSFYKTYQQIYGSPKNNILTGKQGWTQPNIEFGVVIQDESSKATPAELSLPLIYGHKNIVIGDHRQLPPLLSKESFEQSFNFLINRATDEDEKRHLKELKSFVNRNFKKLEISQFERLFHDIPKELKGVFNTQYRMHPAINEVIKQFYRYDGGLGCGLTEIDEYAADNPNIHHPFSRYHGINIPGFITEQDHVLWIDTDSPEMMDGTSRVNYGEVDVIRKVLHYMANSDSYKTYLNEWKEREDKQIGLISFYGKQLRLLKEVCLEVSELPIRVSTVDRFQGMERNIIIVSMVRSNCIAFNKDEMPDWNKYPDFGYMPQENLGFADSPNRLNVALSRAKRLLIIVGNSDHFRKHPIYNNVYQSIGAPYGRIIKASDL